MPNLIGFGHDAAQAFSDSLWPVLGLIVGIPVVGILGKGLIDRISDFFDWQQEKEDLSYERDSLRQLYGSTRGESIFERLRLFSDLSPETKKFITPRDMPEGVSMNEMLTLPEYQKKAIDKMYPKQPYAERLKPEDFKRISLREKLFGHSYEESPLKL